MPARNVENGRFAAASAEKVRESNAKTNRSDAPHPDREVYLFAPAHRFIKN